LIFLGFGDAMKQIFAIFLLLCLILGGCTEDLAPAEREFFAMDTVINVKIWGDETALDAVYDLISADSALFSTYNDTSDIAKLNQDAFLVVRNETAELLQLAIHYSHETAGAFDPTVYPYIKSWRSANDAPPELTHLSDRIGFDKLVLDGNTASLKDRAMIDLGAITKGYCAQRAIDELIHRKVETAIISLGGNVQTLGSKPDGTAWAVGIANPEKPSEAITVVRFHGSMALVTSGTYQRYYEWNGKKYHHILDPQTGYPVENNLASVTVLCQDGTMADAFSTALFVMGYEKAIEFWQARKDFEVIFITKDGSIHATEGAAPLLTDCEFSIIQRIKTS